jgi:hypothetical protein
MNFLLLLAIALPSSAASPHAKSLPDLITYVLKHGKDEKLRPSIDEALGITEAFPEKVMSYSRKDHHFEYEQTIEVVYRSTGDALHPLFFIINDGKAPLTKNSEKTKMRCFRSDLNGTLIATAVATDDGKVAEEHSIPMGADVRSEFENLKSKMLRIPLKDFKTE